MTVTVRRRGSFERAGRIFQEELTRSTAQIAQNVRSVAQAIAPVDSGRLQRNIHVGRLSGSQGYWVYLRASDFPGEFYPMVLEFGSSTIDAREFLEQSGRSYRGSAKADYRRGIQRAKRRARVR